MNSKLTINDLKYDELIIILKTLSVRQLLNCRTVCHKWKAIAEQILESQQVLTLFYNDINHYTKQGINRSVDLFVYK